VHRCAVSEAILIRARRRTSPLPLLRDVSPDQRKNRHGARADKKRGKGLCLHLSLLLPWFLGALDVMAVRFPARSSAAAPPRGRFRFFGHDARASARSVGAVFAGRAGRRGRATRAAVEILGSRGIAGRFCVSGVDPE
jgi:hypothetical protein